jgi:hypothetical protein
MKHERGEHLTGCLLFDLNCARVAMLAAPAAPAAESPEPQPLTDDNWEEWHRKLGWLICAYDVLVAARCARFTGQPADAAMKETP